MHLFIFQQQLIYPEKQPEQDGGFNDIDNHGCSPLLNGFYQLAIFIAFLFEDVSVFVVASF